MYKNMNGEFIGEIVQLLKSNFQATFAWGRGEGGRGGIKSIREVTVNSKEENS